MKHVFGALRRHHWTLVAFLTTLLYVAISTACFAG
jgi:hypothetical protein